MTLAVRTKEPRGARALEVMAGCLVGLAGAVHGLVAPEHFREWWGYGAFFLAATITQIVFGLALATNALDPEHVGEDLARVWKPRLYALGLAGNGAIVLLYVVTRTVGIPFGPGAGAVEGLGPVDIVTTLAEIAAALILGLLVWRARLMPAPR